MRRVAALSVFALLAACTPYTGSASMGVPPDAATDAPLVVVVDGDRPTPRDIATPVDAAPLLCGTVDSPCDPFTDRGCGADLRCQVTSLLPPTFRCGPAGARRLGESCDVDAAESCVAGLQCLSGRCLPLCCAGDEAPCRALSMRSSCAALTDSTRLLGCTVPGECAYRDADTCAEGAQCFPQSDVGETVCRGYGGAALDARCEQQNDCARGLTCVSAGVAFGRCRAVCSPRGQPRCARGSCRSFNDRPIDYGFCEE